MKKTNKNKVKKNKSIKLKKRLSTSILKNGHKSSGVIDPYYLLEMERYDKPIASRKFIIQTLSNKPMNLSNLSRYLGLFGKDKESLKKRLGAMIREGQISLYHKIYSVDKNARFLVGKVYISPNANYGFVDFNGGEDSAFLNYSQLKKVLHRDIVEVCVRKSYKKQKYEATIQKVLEHEITHIIGTLRKKGDIWYIFADYKNIKEPFYVLNDNRCYENYDKKVQSDVFIDGDYVYAKIINYPDKSRGASVEIIKKIENDDSVESIVEKAILTFSLPNQWDEEITNESNNLKLRFLDELENVSKYEFSKDSPLNSRFDLRDRYFITIDGEDARDFDDAVYVDKNTDDSWELYVAIADVSFFVENDTHLDRAAYSRGTSVYFPNKVVPMLPEFLSNDLCSLTPNEDRLAFVCQMKISKKGHLEKSRFYKAIICSKSRQTYTNIYDLINNKKTRKDISISKEVEDSIYNMYSLTKILLDLRKERGALYLEIPETKVWLKNEDKDIDKLDISNRNMAHLMIEEAMILANISAAKIMSDNCSYGIYRIHEPPEYSKLNNLTNMLSNLNINLSPLQLQNQVSLSILLDKFKEMPYMELLSYMVLRSMSQAKYSSKRKGHFGLALEYYSHFTSPIRRYPDLLAHRIIKSILDYKEEKRHNNNPSKALLDNQGLEVSAVHSSYTERRADEATYFVTDKLKCLYMQGFIGDKFEAIVTNINKNAIFIQLNAIPVSGIIPVNSLPLYRKYTFDVESMVLSMQSGDSFYLGCIILIKLLRIDKSSDSLEFEFIDFIKK